MNPEKFSIKNRKGLKIAGEVLLPADPKGLAFVLHGLGGFKEQNHIKAMTETFFTHGYAVVNFDATNSIGESDGRFEDATMQTHYDDLVDVIAWAKKQKWYQEPFCLAGHSLGGYAVARYAEDYPKEVKGVFPYALVVSGKLSLESSKRFRPDELSEWERTGWHKRVSNSKPGVEMRLPWSHMQERLKHDLMPKAGNLTMPVLFVVGEKDESCPPDDERVLFDRIPGPKEFHIIADAPHTFRKPEHLEQLRKILSDWLEK